MLYPFELRAHDGVIGSILIPALLQAEDLCDAKLLKSPSEV